MADDSTTAPVPLRFTISVGVTLLQPASDSIDAVLKRADQAMYNAKSTGRNRVCTVP